MLFDPRLRVPVDVEYDIEVACHPMLEPVTVFMTDCYDFPLVAEFVGEQLRIRAATGDEVAELLSSGGFEEEDGIDWPGDPATATGHEIVWQETASSDPVAEPGCHLWAGEVLLRSGGGVSGPFYIHKQAAQAWAFSAALGMPEDDVFEAQIVPYACARSCAPALLREGDAAYRRFNRFWASPLRPWGEPRTLALPRAAGARAKDRTECS